jgi:hypothetical protein
MSIAGEDRSDKTYTSMLDGKPYHIPLEALVAKECAQTAKRGKLRPTA